MIYKETESVNDKPQEVPDDKIQENVLRGEKLIVRSKKSIQTIFYSSKKNGKNSTIAPKN